MQFIKLADKAGGRPIERVERDGVVLGFCEYSRPSGSGMGRMLGGWTYTPESGGRAIFCPDGPHGGIRVLREGVRRRYT